MDKSALTLSEKIILGLVLLLANLRALVFIFLFPDTAILLGPAWIEIMLWALAAVGILSILLRDKQMPNYLAFWRRNWLLAVFVLFAFASVFWSIGPLVSLFRVLELLFATLVASYYGLRQNSMRMMDVLFWFGALLCIFSLALVFGAPPTGTMLGLPYEGAWRGVYWHRNHLASIVAFLNIVFLLRVLIAVEERNNKGFLDGIFYVVSLIILYFTRSATGYILFIVLHSFLFIVWIWLRINNRLQPKHYYILLGVGIAAGVLILSNLDVVFGLFNRDATMTGRLGLWSQLLEIASQRLWNGYGFGAIWTFKSFREELRLLVGWPSQPLIGDNGLLDIYLHLGIVGLLLFVGVLILVTVRSLRYALVQKSLASFFPLLVVIYAVFANITFSLFIETEVFVWFLIVAVLFMMTTELNAPITQAVATSEYVQS